jgi:PEP-CTERM motif
VIQQPAQAVPVQIDWTIKFDPPSSVSALTLTGMVDFYLPGSTTPIASFNVGSLTSLNPSFTDHFIPTEPCIGGGTCQLSFAFGGSTGSFPTYAFQNDNVPDTDPVTPFALPVGTFIPGDPCITGTVCHASGSIVAFDAPVMVGTWDVTIGVATPLPATFPLLVAGLGAIGLLGWRRKRKTTAATAKA